MVLTTTSHVHGFIIHDGCRTREVRKVLHSVNRWGCEPGLRGAEKGKLPFLYRTVTIV
jgi:hypothetical protein